MEKYRKIQNVFKFSPDFKKIDGFQDLYLALKDLIWIGTEKVDGTNIRVHWDGNSIEYGGRTDNAQFSKEQIEFLDSLFKIKEMEYLFEQVFGDKEAYVFGEMYGPKIQGGGGLYGDKLGFIVFDVTIAGSELNYSNMIDVAYKLGLEFVSLVFTGNLEAAQKFVSEHPMSVINQAHEMEGLVLTPDVDIYDRNGNRIKCKCKYRDMLNAGLVNKEEN